VNKKQLKAEENYNLCDTITVHVFFSFFILNPFITTPLPI
jgi:hypothetical protein